MLPRYEAAKRWVSYYCVQGRLSRLSRVWMRSTAASSGLSSRLLKCDHCECAFDNTIVETLKQIVAFPEALGKHSCECGHPEMRRLPDGVFHCPVCRAEVLPVSIPEPRPVAARKSLAALEQIPLNLGAPDEEGDRPIASGGGGNGG